MFDVANASRPFLLAALVASVAIVLGLRRVAPGRRWVALALAILFGPCGHLYLKGAARYIGLMYAAWILLIVATPLPAMVSGALLTVLSAMLMDVRFRDASAPAKPAEPA